MCLATSHLDVCLIADETLATAASSSASHPPPHELDGGVKAEQATAGQHESATLLGQRLVDALVQAGAVPPLLRLRGLGYPRCGP